MLFSVDPSSPVPVYAQIAEQVKRAIATGVLRPGDALPSLRDVALRLRINPRTIANAYKQLEFEGIVETRHGTGSFITQQAQPPVDAHRRRVLERALDDVFRDAAQMHFPLEDLRRLCLDRLDLAGEVYAAAGDRSRNGCEPTGRDPDGRADEALRETARGR